MTERSSSEVRVMEAAPQLLVSVRSPDEAQAAVAGGCGVLDVKEPQRGPLGMADVSVIERVLKIGDAAGVPVSAALGEVTDYSASSDNSRPEWSGSLTGLSFMKMGLSGLSHDRAWKSRWHDTMRQLSGSLTRAGRGALQERSWVAVIYADWQLARSPSPEAIVDGVLSSGLSTDDCIAGVLVDTWAKQSGRLLDHLPVEQLRFLASTVQQSGRFFAIAGRLTPAMVPELVEVQPDIIGVRSAACLNEDRTSRVAEKAVRHLRVCIDQAFASDSEGSVLPIGASGASRDQL